MSKKLFSLVRVASFRCGFRYSHSRSLCALAAIVIDADGIYEAYEENADTRLHPAGFTKLMFCVY